jgi:membrane-associated protein
MDIWGFDIATLIKTVGLFGVWAIVFAESGLLIGFMLPGDSLLFTAGFLASQGYLEIVPLALGSFIAAILGDAVGYYFGKKTGKRIFKKEEGWFFHKDRLLEAKVFYDTYGPWAIILARFMPVVRTLAPILAGVGEMPYRTFFVANVAGAVVWAVGLSLGGYYLGQLIPDADRYLLPIIVVIIFTSFLPGIIRLTKNYYRKWLN